MCKNHSVSNLFNGLNFLNHDYFEEVGPHEPLVLKVGCYDARMGGRMMNLEAGKVLYPRTAGATLPQTLDFDYNLDGIFALADLKGVEQIILVPHSDCLAAKLVLKYPDAADIPHDTPKYNQLMRLHRNVQSVGVNLKQYADLCWAESGGDEREAVDLMAKRLSVASLANLMHMPLLEDGEMTVGEGIVAKKINVAVVFVHIDEERFEYLSLDDMKFHPINPNAEAPNHMCVRKNDCAGCHCGEQVTQITQKITFYPQGLSTRELAVP